MPSGRTRPAAPKCRRVAGRRLPGAPGAGEVAEPVGLQHGEDARGQHLGPDQQGAGHPDDASHDAQFGDDQPPCGSGGDKTLKPDRNAKTRSVTSDVGGTSTDCRIRARLTLTPSSDLDTAAHDRLRHANLPDLPPMALGL